MPEIASAPRLKLVLGKYRVIKVESNALTTRFTLDMGNAVKITIDAPPYIDIREGDLLTLYTEVLLHANAQQPSKQ